MQRVALMLIFLCAASVGSAVAESVKSKQVVAQRKRAVFSDSIDEYEFDNRGRKVRTTTIYGGRTFSIFNDGSEIRVDGLPVLRVHKNPAGLVTSVTADGKEIVSHEYDTKHEVSRIVLDQTWSLALSEVGDPPRSQTRYALVDRRGMTLHETIAENQGAKRSRVADYDLGVIAAR